MERLTEEIQIGPFASLKDKAEAVPGAFGTYDCLYAHMVAVTRLKEYEDVMPLERVQELAQAEKDGRLVVLPYKIGDLVYRIAVRKKYLNHSMDTPYIKVIGIKTENALKYKSEIGKTVFLTREEAEAALKKREEAT